MTSRILLVVAAVALVGCEQSTAPTHLRQAPGTSSHSASTSSFNQTVPISGYAYNQCNNEYVNLAGNEHFEESVVLQPGSMHGQIHINFADVQGTGASTGLKYVLNASENEQVQATSSTFSQTAVLNEELVSQSSAPNLNIKITQDFSFDGSNYTYSQPRFSITCNG